MTSAAADPKQIKENLYDRVLKSDPENREALLAVACSFSGYHAMRRKAFCFVGDELVIREDFMHVDLARELVNEFAQVFYIEAAEVCLDCRAPRNINLEN